MSWRGHRVAHDVHQNAPKWTNLDQNGQQSMTEQKCFNFVMSDFFDRFLDEIAQFTIDHLLLIKLSLTTKCISPRSVLD